MNSNFPSPTTAIPRLVRGTHTRLARIVFMGGPDEPGHDGAKKALLVLCLLLAACSQAPGLERLAAGETGRVVQVRTRAAPSRSSWASSQGPPTIRTWASALPYLLRRAPP